MSLQAVETQYNCLDFSGTPQIRTESLPQCADTWYPSLTQTATQRSTGVQQSAAAVASCSGEIYTVCLRSCSRLCYVPVWAFCRLMVPLPTWGSTPVLDHPLMVAYSPSYDLRRRFQHEVLCYTITDKQYSL